MDEHVLFRIFGGDETEAFFRLEPFDRTGHFLLRPLGMILGGVILRRMMLRRRRCAGAERLDDPHDLRPFRAVADFANQLGLIAQFLQAGAMQYGYMKKSIRRAIDRRDESKSFSGIEPLKACPNRYITFGSKFVLKTRQTNRP